MKPRKGSHRLRLARHSQSGFTYLVTTATQNRRPLLSHRDAAGVVLAALRWLDQQGRITWEAGVIMPDHVHFIAELRAGTLGQVMQVLKGYSARRINEVLGRQGQVWQPQYHDHALRSNEALGEVVRYCLENPVRAGLARDFHEYPYWYCRYPV